MWRCCVFMLRYVLLSRASDLGLDHGAQGEHNVEQALAKIADPNSSGAPENEEYIALLNKEVRYALIASFSHRLISQLVSQA